MKQRRIIATILTIILTLATVLTVFAAFRFEVQFPSKLNTFTYDQSSASFILNGNNSFTLNLSDPGSAGNFSAVVVGDKDIPATEAGEDTPATPGRAGTPLMYSYKLSLPAGYSVETNKVLLSSIFVYLNGEIQGTLYSVMTDNLGMIGTTSYVLPNDSVTDDLRLELHLASDATPYIQNATTDGEGNVSNKNSSLTVTVNCTATNHNAQKYTFVNSTENLIQAISEVNRGAQNKTIVLYNNVEITSDVPAVTKPCTFDVQSATFTTPIAVNIESDPVDGVPTDIVTVLSSKGAFDPKDQNGDAVDVNGFTITKGAIDRADNAYKVGIIVGEGANHYSIQYIIDSHLESLIAHGMHAGAALDLSFKGFGCYIESVTSSDTSVLQIVSNGKALYPADIDVSKVVTATIKMITGDTHTHTVKVIGHNDAELQNLLNDELKYIKDLTVAGTDVSFSIPLPTVIKSKNATIEWHSSDPEKFSSQGVCSPSANGYVTLTAVIRINEAVYTENFKIHIATLTNKDRLEAMISAMGTITLNKLYPSEASGNTDGLIDGNYSDLPLAHAKDSGYEQYFQFAIPQNDEETRQLSTFDISELTYSIDKATYSYIDLVEFTDTPAQGDTPAQTHQVVVLRQSTFNTLAEVQVTAKFETGDSKEETSTIYVNIKLGNNQELGDQILAYVQNQLNNVDVLQNMLDTRGIDEKGDFTLPTEYSGFKILYTIGSANQTIAEVSNGTVTVHPENFKTSYYSVPIHVQVLIKGEENTGENDANVFASRTMYFDVPPVIRADEYGFMDYNAAGQTATNLLLTEIREQVNEQLPTSEQWTTADANNPYILLRDIQHANVQSLEIDLTNAPLNTTGYKASSINGLAYFTNLTKFTVKGLQSLTYVDDKNTTDTSDDTVVTEATAIQLARVAATYHGLTELTLSNVGLTDLSPILSLTNLTKLDISGNTALENITGLVKYDATKLAELNISGTAVNMTHARPLLTDMYYKYETANQNSEQKTPIYKYTHEYTPIADGALLLEPDAISVSGSTATVAGSEILISNVEKNSDTSVEALTGGASIQIDGEKSIAVPAGTVITSKKGSFVISDATDSAVALNAILTFPLGVNSESSTTAVIVDVLYSGVVTISNVTDVDGNILTVASGSTLSVTEYGTTTAITRNLPAGQVPVLCGVIAQNGTTVTITPLKGATGEYSFPGISDEGDNSKIENATDTNGNTINLTQVEITGGSLDGNIVNIGATGGTIKITHASGTPYTFVVSANTNITISQGSQKVIENGVIKITQIDTAQSYNNATDVTFTNAIIYDNTDTIETDAQGTRYTVHKPTIRTNDNCTMIIGGSIYIDLPANVELPLPEGVVGSMQKNQVNLQTLSASGITFNGAGKTLVIYNAQRQSTPSEHLTFNSRGWTITNNRTSFNAQASLKAGYGTPYLYCESDGLWISLNISGTKYLNLTGNTLVGQDVWVGYRLDQGQIDDNWGTITNTTNNSVTLAFGPQSHINTNNSPYTGVDKFSISVALFSPTITLSPISVTLPTASINPTYAGIRTVEEKKSAEMNTSSAVYYSKTNTLPTTFGCTLNGTAVTLTSDTWSAIYIDGEYITISDNPTSVTVVPENGVYKITVTGGTSTIGKGALISGTTANPNVTYDTFSTKTAELNTVVNGAPTNVTVNYSTVNGFTHAKVNGMIFEPLALAAEEKQGLTFLYLLSEIPNVAHFYSNGNGSFIQLASTVYYDVGGGKSVKVAWEVIDDGGAIIRNDYFGTPRLETIHGLATGDYEVTLRAQVNVNGVVTYRYFTFTVTYY